MKSNVYDYIVIGSGFGGSVSAMRLAKKGYSVLVIEKGKRYQTKDFPKTNWNLRKFLWMPKIGLYGIQCMTLLKDVFILHGSGVGGGSLVYANTLLKPDKSALQNWDDGSWANRLEPFYKKAKIMLGVTPSPKLSEPDKYLKECLPYFKTEGSFSPVDVGVFFGEEEKEVDDPYFNGEGPSRAGCNFCGGCMVGCRFNAKNTLDKNYLYFAEKYGAKVLPEFDVTCIDKLANKQFEITCKKSTGYMHKTQMFICNNLILSAGVLGTIKLLLKSKKRNSIKNIPSLVGDKVRTNSETLLGVISNGKDVDYTHGLAIQSQAKLDKNTQVELVRYGKNQDAMAFLGTVLTNGGRYPRIIYWFFAILQHPISFLKNFNPFGWSKKSTILLVMQTLEGYLKLNFERRWWRFGFQTLNSTRNTSQRVPSYIPSANKLATFMAKKMNGRACSSVPEALLNTATTAHILGGCVLGEDKKSAVVNHELKVFGHDNLYVIDGSVIPENLGVNPSLTITAVAEYAMAQIPNKRKI
jgi:cholesterol oxidase